MNCYPVPRGTREPSAGGASTEVRPHLGWLVAPVGSGDRVKRQSQPRMLSGLKRRVT